MRNVELEKMCRALAKRVEELEARLDGGETPEPIFEPVVEPEPEPELSEYEKAVEAHNTMVKPFVMEWKAEVDAECERREQEYWEVNRVRPTTWKKQMIRDHVKRDIPYAGPVQDYDNWVASEKYKEAIAAPERDRQARREGLPTGYFRDPMGLIRNEKTGEPIDREDNAVIKAYKAERAKEASSDA